MEGKGKYMISSRSIRVGIGLGAVALLAAACSSTSTPASTTSTVKKVRTTVAAPVPVLKTATVTISGKPTVVLVNNQGYTLYYFTPDTSSAAKCTASFKLPNGKACTLVWPPLVLSSGTPSSTASLSGTLSTVSDGNGRQVEYQGHPLYHFAGDTAPGQANGQGLLGKWWVATPGLGSVASPSSTSKSTNPSSHSASTYSSGSSTSPSGAYGGSTGTPSYGGSTGTPSYGGSTGAPSVPPSYGGSTGSYG